MPPDQSGELCIDSNISLATLFIFLLVSSHKLLRYHFIHKMDQFRLMHVWEHYAIISHISSHRNPDLKNKFVIYEHNLDYQVR
jgi:hypothetical protein